MRRFERLERAEAELVDVDPAADTVRQFLTRPSEKAFDRVSHSLAFAFFALRQLGADLRTLKTELEAVEVRLSPIEVRSAPPPGPDGKPIKRGPGRPKGAKNYKIHLAARLAPPNGHDRHS